MGNGRGYEHSHPWISFTVDLRPAAVRVWSLLGQAVAGCRQIAETALPPLAAAEMYRLYLSRGARATTAIEGNTLSEAQVRARLDGQLELPLSQEYLGREVDNVLDACERIWQEISGGHVPRLSPDLLADYTQHGANRLAAVGLTALTVVPERRAGKARLGILGGGRDPDGAFTFTWPLWRDPISLVTIRALLGHPGLDNPTTRAELGIVDRLRTRRVSFGRYMNFTRAESIVL